MGKIYGGKIINIVQFGCFVELDVKNKDHALIHISQVVAVVVVESTHLFS